MPDSHPGDPELCPRGHRRFPGAQLCHACFLAVGLAPTEPARGKPAVMPDEIDGYAIEEELGSGAHGTVYRARQPGAGKTVALKVSWNGEPDRELRNHVHMEHPNIVPVFDAGGLHHDPPYFAMQLVKGGTLAERQAAFQVPARALELVIAIAEGIQYAHERFVLHRDLKPTNILIDASNRPLVSDFSVAKQLDGPEPATSGTIAGTLPFMAPEQAGVIAAPVTTASDVYGLGAILYYVLTSGPPRPVESLPELKASFDAHELPPAIEAPGVDDALRAVCMRALSKDPDERYRSAALFAADLKRLKEGRWPTCLTPSFGQRVQRWATRNAWLAGSIALGAALLTAINVTTVNSVSSQEAELKQQMLNANAALAKAQAQAALAELTRYRDEVARMVSAAQPLLEGYARLPPEQDASRPELALAMAPFDSLFVAGCDGKIRAHSFDDDLRARFPNGPPGYYRRSYAFRNYFHGAMELAKRGAREVYLSRAFRSTWDSRFKFAFSTPIYASSETDRTCPGTRAVGIFFAARSASSALGQVQIPELEGSGQRTALFGPRDRDDEKAAIPPVSAFHVLVHENLRLGDEQRVDPRLARRLSRHFEPAAPPGRQFEPPTARPYKDADYVDSVDETHGRWLGGFYPVGQTGFVLGVQTAYGTATAPARHVGMLPALNIGFFAYCACALWLSQRRRPSQSA